MRKQRSEHDFKADKILFTKQSVTILSGKCGYHQKNNTLSFRLKILKPITEAHGIQTGRCGELVVSAALRPAAKSSSPGWRASLHSLNASPHRGDLVSLQGE